MLWQIVLLVMTLAWLWNEWSKTRNHPLLKLPGPPRLPIIGNALDFARFPSHRLLEVMMEFRKKYGNRYVLQMFNRVVLHVYGEKDVEAVLSHSRNITKNKSYSFIRPWLGNGLLLSTGSKWHRRRKILTPTFHFNILKNFSTVMEEKSQDLVERLMGQVRGGADVIELLPVVSDCTLYTICETAMGTQLDVDKSDKSLEYKREILNISEIAIHRMTKAWLHPNFIFNMTSLGKRFAKSVLQVLSFSDDVILERKMKRQTEDKTFSDSDDVGRKKRLAFLDLLLDAERKGEIDLEGIRDEVNTFMFEGHDTTAIALAFGLMLLANHEDVQEKIFEECQAIFGESKRTPSLTDQAEMKYLEAVIKETLRLYPSVPVVAREITEDFLLEGNLVVPKGSEVVVQIYGLHRRADLYPDPEAFKPERFLGADHRHPYAYVPFSAGPRNCIGQRFAMQEMKCVLAQIVRNFKLAPVSGGGLPRVTADLLLRSIEPVYAKFIPR